VKQEYQRILDKKANKKGSSVIRRGGVFLDVCASSLLTRGRFSNLSLSKILIFFEEARTHGKNCPEILIGFQSNSSLWLRGFPVKILNYL